MIEADAVYFTRRVEAIFLLSKARDLAPHERRELNLTSIVLADHNERTINRHRYAL